MERASVQPRYLESSGKPRIPRLCGRPAHQWQLIQKSERLVRNKGPKLRNEITKNSARPRRPMENRIKEQQLDLFADRTSCHRFLANQFRLLLSSVAYVLVQALRRTALAGTELAQAQVGTIRLKVLKVAARVRVSVRRVVFHLASSYPYQALFRHVWARVMGLPRVARGSG